MYDVIQVSTTDNKVTVLAENRTKATAEKIVEVAVYRRGVEDKFYTTCPAGGYEDGCVYQGEY